jgi:hypothetical protein
MRFLPLILPLFLAKPSIAVFQDEAGQTDFTISTAGHGIIGATYAQITSDQKSVLTSSSSPSGSATAVDCPKSGNGGGCYLSSRLLDDGSLNWRRNVCSQPSSSSSVSIRHAVYSTVDDERVYTLDDAGMLRIWNDTDGAMMKEIPMSLDVSLASGVPRLVSLSDDLMGGILTTVDETEIIVFFNDEQFKDTFVSANHILKKAHVKSDGKAVPSIFGVLPSSDGSIYVVAGWAYVDSDMAITTLSEMAMVEISFVDGDVQVSKDCKNLHHGSKDPLLVSSIRVDNGDFVATMAGKYDQIVYSPSKKSIEERSGSATPWVECESVIVDSETMKLASPIASMHKLQCNKDVVTVLASTQSGTTHVFTVK